MGAGENHTEKSANLKAVEEERLMAEGPGSMEPGTKKPNEEGVRTPPDGGWGWVVVFASFMCNMVLDGIAYSYGILLNALMEHFGGGKGLISLVGSILAGVIMLVGPIASALTNKFGTRVVCILGAVTSSFAIFISTYSPNVPFLMFSYGVVGGLGLGLMYVPAVVAVGYWFEKRRSLVTGISTCGSGAGTIVFAPLATVLVENYGWQGCNQILAGLCLMCALFGLTMKPVPLRKPDEEDSMTELKAKEKENEAGPYSTAEFDYMDGENGTVELKHEPQVVTKKPEKTGIWKTLRNPAFLLIMLANLPAVMGLYIPYMFLPAMSEERGLTKNQGALLISLIGLFNTAGRVISGAITDHPKIDALFVTCFALLFGAVCPFLMDLCDSFPTYIVVAILFGLSLSAWPAVTSSMLVDLLGLEQLTTGFGALTCIRGLAAFLGPPLGGLVIDLSGGNYSYAFWISAILLGSSSIVHFIAFYVKRRIQAK